MDGITNRLGVKAVNQNSGNCVCPFCAANCAWCCNANLKIVAALYVGSANSDAEPAEVVMRVAGLVRDEVRPIEVVVGLQRVNFGANHDRLRHITEGFYDTALNEANDA